MKSVALVFIFIGTCYCQVDFNERPRNFSIELLYFTQSETDGHVVLSPFGIWTLMTGIALGARGNSYRQLSRTFILPNNQDSLLSGYKQLTNSVLAQSDGVSLASKNFVFLDNGFPVYPEYKNTIQNGFGALLRVLDFSDRDSARIANTYIEKSGGRVSNVLHSDDFSDSRMILANVISFKGLWSLPFNKTDTVLEEFLNENQKVIGKVNMMFQKGPFPFSNMQSLKSFVLELPYGTDGKYSMLLILPYSSVKILDIYKKFSHVTLKDVFKKLQTDVDFYGLNDVDVKLPRFRISTNLVLNKPLNDMGVYDIFEPGVANFRGVTNSGLFVSAVVHKADIEVTESGTVASAATVAEFVDKISPPYFHANRPFLYFIMEKPTTTVIFSGIYSKPTIY